ncbi:hypothetical protein J5J10_15690 [Ciceribacter sp. L1K23]|uniref:hypothetical protein n=1 Tax=Ciceribacter sp. L1K23 TaxID=2820276 RepID=UPI001B818001|nr:hypothetical protein [Ciceribacter sp. L1K23]MBR0557131.1 hypothetical protein [Ciceribacter sp. L1K23]
MSSSPLPAVAAFVLVLSLLSSCTTVDPQTAAKLAALSPLDADPGQLRVAIKLPAPLELGNGNALLTMGWSPGGGVPIHHTYRLNVTETPNAIAGLEVLLGPGEKLVVLSLAARDVVGLRAFQGKIRAEKQEGSDGKGSLSVRISGGCWQGDFPAATSRLPFEIWLRTSPHEDYLPLVQNANLMDGLSPAGVTTIQRCS